HCACPTCSGMGVTHDFDTDLLMPDAHLSLRQGALALYQGGPFKQRHRERLWREAAHILGIDVDAPFANTHERQRQAFWHGMSGRTGAFEGLLPHCRRLLESSSRDSVRTYLEQFMRQVTCIDCHGPRLNAQAGAVRIAGRGLCALLSLSVATAVDCVPELALNARERAIAEPLLPEITARLQCMQEVGLG